MKNLNINLSDNVHRLSRAVASLLLTLAPAGAAVLVTENFAGTGSALNGTTADTFDAALTTAGGSGTWAAGSSFLDNGTVSADANINRSAYLNLGTYVTNAAGSPTGSFSLSLTLGETTGAWIAVGFAQENTPNLLRNFTNGTGGTGTTTGVGTILYRAQTASPSGELDMFGGNGNLNPIDGPDSNTGSRTLIITLDLTPAGGYNGSSNFGTVKWADSALGDLGSYTFPTARTYGSILISESANSGGTLSNLSLSQIPEPSGTALLSTLSLLGLTLRRRA